MSYFSTQLKPAIPEDDLFHDNNIVVVEAPNPLSPDHTNTLNNLLSGASANTTYYLNGAWKLNNIVNLPTVAKVRLVFDKSIEPNITTTVSGAYLFYSATGADRFSIRGANCEADARKAAFFMRMIGGRGLDFRDNDIFNMGMLLVLVNGGNVHKKLKIRRCGNSASDVGGIQLQAVDDVLLEYVSLHDNAQDGLKWNLAPASNGIVRHFIAQKNGDNGIDTYGGGGNLYFDDITLVRNSFTIKNIGNVNNARNNPGVEFVEWRNLGNIEVGRLILNNSAIVMNSAYDPGGLEILGPDQGNFNGYDNIYFREITSHGNYDVNPNALIQSNGACNFRIDKLTAITRGKQQIVDIRAPKGASHIKNLDITSDIRYLETDNLRGTYFIDVKAINEPSLFGRQAPGHHLTIDNAIFRNGRRTFQASKTATYGCLGYTVQNVTHINPYEPTTNNLGISAEATGNYLKQNNSFVYGPRYTNAEATDAVGANKIRIYFDENITGTAQASEFTLTMPAPNDTLGVSSAAVTSNYIELTLDGNIIEDAGAATISYRIAGTITGATTGRELFNADNKVLNNEIGGNVTVSPPVQIMNLIEIAPTILVNATPLTSSFLSSGLGDMAAGHGAALTQRGAFTQYYNNPISANWPAIHDISSTSTIAGSQIRVAAAATGPKLVRFLANANFVLTSDISFNNGNMTLIGTLNEGGGQGVSLVDRKTQIRGPNNIVRGIRFRARNAAGVDSLEVIAATNTIIDHCEMWHADDENCAVYSSQNVTVSYCIITSAIAEGEPGKNSLINGNQDSDLVTMHHCILAHSQNRNPRTGGKRTYPGAARTRSHYANILVYNYGNRKMILDANTITNVHNVYFINGADSAETFEGFAMPGVELNTESTIPSSTPAGNDHNTQVYLKSVVTKAGGIRTGDTGPETDVFGRVVYDEGTPTAWSDPLTRFHSATEIAEAKPTIAPAVLTHAGLKADLIAKAGCPVKISDTTTLLGEVDAETGGNIPTTTPAAYAALTNGTAPTIDGPSGLRDSFMSKYSIAQGPTYEGVKGTDIGLPFETYLLEQDAHEWGGFE